jgi:hypothetical protein
MFGFKLITNEEYEKLRCCITNEEYEKLLCCKVKMLEIEAIEKSVKGELWDNIEEGKRYVGDFGPRPKEICTDHVLELTMDKEMVYMNMRGWMKPNEFMARVNYELKRREDAKS